MCPHFSESTKWLPSKCLFHHRDFLGTGQTFGVAISFPDMLEQFQRHIQNPHSQVVLMIPISVLQAYPEQSSFEDVKSIREQLFRRQKPEEISRIIF
jgi:hypothetical protein